MPKNLIEKIWDSHVVKSKDGYPDIFAIDLHLVHEVTSPQAFDELKKRGLNLHAVHRTVATVDHNVSTAKNRKIVTDPGSRNQLNALYKNCQEFGVKLLDMDSGKQGIVHVIAPELGLTQPGITVVCGDSHTSTHGAFGAIGFGIGTTEISHVMASGCILQSRPKTMKVVFKGKMGKAITSKDLVLKLIHDIGIAGATGHIIEYTGEVISDLSMEERMTICNMSIECGARAGLIAPDKVTFEYLKNKICSPKDERWSEAVKYWQSLVSDEGCSYNSVVEVDVENLAPMVTWGTNPGQSVCIDEKTPGLNNLNGDIADAYSKAFEYVQIIPGSAIVGTKIDYVFIGSCTNARLQDMEAVAGIFKNHKVAEGVEVYIVPGSEQVRDLAIAKGLDKIFEAAGADFRNPGCSMCLAMNEDKVPEGKRCASTSNRNFVGRQGKGAITHLMSPIMAAAAAVTGEITDVREFI